jgi:S1-C subfamily serine protease
MSGNPHVRRPPMQAPKRNGPMAIAQAYHTWLGIPPSCSSPDHYQILGIAHFESNFDVISSAADRQMAHVRTFQIGQNSELSQRILNDIAAAKLCLLSATRKQTYDAALQRSMSAQALGIGPPRKSAKRSTQTVWIAAAVTCACLMLTGFALLLVQILDRSNPVVAGNETKVPALPPFSRAAEPVQPQRDAPAIQRRPQIPSVTPISADRNGGFGSWRPHEIGSNPNDSQPFPTAAVPAASQDAHPAQASLADVVELVEKSVVRINVICDDGAEAIGSGLIAANDSTVVTNYHVIEGARTAEVEFKDGLRAKVAGFRAVDPTRDIAVLQLASPLAGHPPLQISANLPRQGDAVSAIGAPRGFSFTLSNGIVSAIRTGAECAQITPFFAASDPKMTWIQTTSPISPGNSGGPLISADGEVLGINTLTRTDSQNLNFAVSCRDVNDVLGHAGNQAQLLVTLPKRAVRIHASALANPAERHETISLPSGRVVDLKVMFLDVLQSQLKGSGFFPPGQFIANLSFDSGRPYAMASEEHGKLQGPTLTLNEIGKPAIVASYAEGVVHGNLMIWNEQGARVLFAQYFEREAKWRVVLVQQQ